MSPGFFLEHCFIIKLLSSFLFYSIKRDFEINAEKRHVITKLLKTII